MMQLLLILTGFIGGWFLMREVRRRPVVQMEGMSEAWLDDHYRQARWDARAGHYLEELR